ncbi:MAG: S1C family serine protease, partial [Candidatus Hydrogenedentes bacterium]|nr:S1C family serine protease [Candidatus Hydrogenedentota bacterium]
SQEAPQEVSGTVIGADGLTVVSLNRADPSTMLRQLYGDQEGFDISSEIKDVKILMEDNSEVDAEVVLRDKDLDLAFIRPLEKPEAEFAHVSLDIAPEVKIFDPVIVLNRLGTVARRTYAVSLDRIDAIVEKPRKFYLPSSAQNRSELGSPVFTAGGEFIGIGVIRAIQGEQSFFGGGENFTIIIVPASDIKESAIQVPPFGQKAPDESAEEAAAQEAPAES